MKCIHVSFQDSSIKQDKVPRWEFDRMSYFAGESSVTEGFSNSFFEIYFEYYTASRIKRVLFTDGNLAIQRSVKVCRRLFRLDTLSMKYMLLP